MNGQKEDQLALLASELPEVYQPLYGHGELSGDVSRPCVDRLNTVFRIYDALQTQLSRPLRVLDLGCAQGFFSFSLAERGAEVFGLDCLDKNIAVCHALAEEHPEFKVQFETGRIEEFCGRLEADSYDLVLCLSVFHHIIHEKGLEAAQGIADSLAGSAGLLLVETALREEPLYWAESQPEDPRSLFKNCSFVQETAQHETHLSSVSRPLYAVGNHFWVVGDVCGALESWTDEPHAFAQGTHQGGRRYFFSPNAVVKKYRFDHSRGWINRQEFEREVAFFKNIPEGFSAPACLASTGCETEGWVVLERLPGRLLLDLIRESADLDHMAVLHSVLEQLAALEAAGLYHNDVRTWNVLVEENGKPVLLDAGSISSEQNDCVWPENVFLSFFIFVHELLTGEIAPVDSLRILRMTPYSLPQPYRSWAAAIWQYPVDEWSFGLMLKLMDPSTEISQIELYQPLGIWIGAVEKAVERQIEFVLHLKKQIENTGGALDELLEVAERMEHAAAEIQEHTCHVVAGAESARMRTEERARQAEERAVRSETRSRQNIRLALSEARHAEQAEKRAGGLEVRLNSVSDRLLDAVRQIQEQTGILQQLESDKTDLTDEIHRLELSKENVQGTLDTAMDKVDELNQSSHHWWTVAHGLTGELHDMRKRSQWLENEWNSAKAKIDELNHVSHHWWTVADTFRRQLDDVHGSRCVRWTTPLRWISMQLRRLRHEGLLARLKALVKKILRPLARAIGRMILRHSRFKEEIRNQLAKHPRLDARARRFARENNLIRGAESFDPVRGEGSACGSAPHSGFSGMLVGFSGLFGPEPWGCWSNGKEVEFSFEEPLPDRFTLSLITKAFGPNAGQECAVRVGRAQGVFVAEAEPVQINIELSNPDRSNRLVIEIPEPISPADLSNSTDHRKLGLGLCDLAIVEGAHVCKIDFQCLETQLMSPRSREMYQMLKRAQAGQREFECAL